MLGAVTGLVLLFRLRILVWFGDFLPLHQEACLYDNADKALQRFGQVWCSRVPGFVLCAVLAFFCSGCFMLAVGAVGGVAGAVYMMGKLKDEVNYEVPTVHKATVAALAELELKLLEDKVDKLSAHVESEFSGGEHVWIDLESLSNSRTSLTIRVGITGNEVRARKIHDAIKRHLS